MCFHNFQYLQTNQDYEYIRAPRIENFTVSLEINCPR